MPEMSRGSAGKAVKVFCSYAHNDERWREKLVRHLSQLTRDGLLDVWHDRKIRAGANWPRAIDENLDSAGLVLLLISPDFMASQYCYGIEMKRALERHEAGQAVVIPILLRPCDWQTAPFAQLQALPAGKFISEWSERDEDAAFASVARGIRELLAVPADPAVVSLSGEQNGAWNVPFTRNPFFTAREEQLAQIHAQLRSGQSVAIGQVQAISGLGGIGKTQLAVEYAYRHRQEYRAVLWVRADTLETLNGSYSDIASRLNLPEKDAREQALVVQAVKTWLETHPGWLLILDNLDEPRVLFPLDDHDQPRRTSPFLPATPGGSILLTTRATDLASLGLGIAHPLAMTILTPEQGARLLLQRANLLAINAPLVSLASPDIQLAEQLSRELGGLALALDQAGAYLASTSDSLASYLALFQQRSQDLLQQRRAHEHPDPVATTWSLAFEHVEARNPAATELLRFCSFLAPDAIPEEILTVGAKHLGETLAPVAADAFQFNAAIEALRAYSLITRDPQARTLTVHRLVQLIQRDSLDSEAQQQWKRRVVLAVEAAFPDVEFETWPTCERLLPHALICALWIEDTLMETQDASRVLGQTGVYLNDRGRYAEAELFYQKALALNEQMHGQEHPAVAIYLNNLAIMYQIQGEYEEAEQLYQRALAIDEQAHGQEHPDVARGLNNLAIVYRRQGKYEEAERLLLRTLTIDEQAYGQEHPEVAADLNNLAIVYKDQGKYEEAERLYLRALAIDEQAHGQEHPDVARGLNNLAVLYEDQGKYEEAERLHLRALAIDEQVYGQEHPKVASHLNNLAIVYDRQGKHEKAERLYLRALKIRERHLGPQHPDTQRTRRNYDRLQQKMQQAARPDKKRRRWGWW